MKWQIKWWNVARDVAVIMALNYFSTIVALLYIGVFSIGEGDRITVVRYFNEAAIVLGFILAASWGRLAKVPRLQHIVVVGVCFWFTYVFLITVLHAQLQWSTVFSYIPLFALYAFVGGGASLMFAPPRQSEDDSPQQSPAPRTRSPERRG